MCTVKISPNYIQTVNFKWFSATAELLKLQIKLLKNCNWNLTKIIILQWTEHEMKSLWPELNNNWKRIFSEVQKTSTCKPKQKIHNGNVGHCDGHPAEYRWHSLFNAATSGSRPLLSACSNDAKTRNPLKFAGVPQTLQQISTTSGPKFTILWGHVGEILVFNKFFF